MTWASRRMVRFGGAACALAVFGLLGGAPTTAEETAPTLTVTGHGTAAAAPDMALLRIGVQSKAGAASEAMDRTSRSTAKVIELLQEAGLTSRQIQTQGLALQPTYGKQGSYGSGAAAGFIAVNTVTARIDELSGLGTLIDALVTGGANRIDGITFAISDPKPLKAIARRTAVSEARQAAKTIAGAAGLKLGEILEMREGGQSAPHAVHRAAAFSAEAVPIAAGELTISAMVTIVWRLMPSN